MVLCALPSVAWGFSDSPRAASADSLAGACTRVNDGANGDVIQCTSAGGNFFIHRTFPREATNGAVQVYLSLDTPDVGPVGNACSMVCIGVVTDQHRLSDINLSACTALTNVNISSISNLLNISNMGVVIPKDTTGALCGTCPVPGPGTVCCAGADEYIDVLRFDSSNCAATQSTNLVNYRSVTIVYQ